ncbi:MAG: hypothetical protein M1817_005381 [Caeruleum heppii]|nr:MAG: hypothetical protein M1817_005381 [Caeruleum heppii]
MKSYLDLINECDSFPSQVTHPQNYQARLEDCYKLMHVDKPLGYITTPVINSLQHFKEASTDTVGRCFQLDYQSHTVRISGSTIDERSKSVATISEAWRDSGRFKTVSKWRNELYSVYDSDQKILFNVERAASPLFGVVTYGVHMTAFVRTTDGIKIWVPRRAREKHTYGGMLDNTVAGGISVGEGPLETLVREAEEEASFPEDLVREHAKACGTVSYFYVREERAGGEAGYLQPECQYVYDLEVGEEVVPEVNDGEVEEFRLWDIGMIKEALAKGEFKPNCALVMLDFFIRHGILTPENEADYIEVVARLHRRFEFPTA